MIIIISIEDDKKIAVSHSIPLWDSLVFFLKLHSSQSHQNQNSKPSGCWWNTALHRRLRSRTSANGIIS